MAPQSKVFGKYRLQKGLLEQARDIELEISVCAAMHLARVDLFANIS
jgi:hypothetical protein